MIGRLVALLIHIPTVLCAGAMTETGARSGGNTGSTKGAINRADYDRLAHSLSGLVDFETYQTLPEPGQPVTGLARFAGLTIGAKLAGQTHQSVDGFDQLSGTPTSGVKAVADGEKPIFAVAFHAGFGSNAAFPIGPDGFAKRSGRGEGALSLVFDTPTAALGLRLHADYQDPLGSRARPGLVTLRFYDASGGLIGEHRVQPGYGVNDIALRITPAAKAATITHKDPGGIAVDDIRYVMIRPLS